MAAPEAAIAWAPNPGPQTSFLRSRVYEVLFGGAAGGGKTAALLIDALRQVERPRYRALIIRRSYPELREIMSRARELYPVAWPGARFNKADRTWTFPNGATIEFGYLGTDDDVYRYQGQEYAYVAFDELTHFSEFAYTYLLSRCRSTDPLIQCRIRATANPGGRGHAWVKARFIDAAAPGVVHIDPATGSTRQFIPSLLADNPHLAATDYGRRLEALPEADRRALLLGDWHAYEGQVFRLDAGVNLISAEQARAIWQGDAPPADWPRFRMLDWGYARPFALLWIAVGPGDVGYVYREWYGVALDSKGAFVPNQGARLEPEEVAKRVAAIEAAAGEREVTGWTGPDLFDTGRRDHGAGRPIAEAFTKHGVYFTEWPAGPGSRIAKKMQVHQRLSFKRDGAGNLVEGPGLVIVADAAPHLARTLPALEYDEHRPEDVDTTGEDHCLVGETIVETLSGPRAIASLVGTSGLLWSFDGARPVLKPYTDCRMTRVNTPVYEVRLVDGRSIRATDYHPVMLVSGEWVLVGQLVPGDAIMDVGSTGMIPSTLSGGVDNDRRDSVCDEPIIRWGHVLPVREVFSTQGAAPASCGVGILERPDSEGLARTPQGPQSGEQRAGKPGSCAGTDAFALPLQYAGVQGGEACAHVDGDAGKGEGLAPLARGSRVASGACTQVMGGQVGRGNHLRGVRGSEADAISEQNEVLREALYEQSANASQKPGCGGARVAEVVYAGLADVYNLEVADTHCFAVAGGLIVHNCYDALAAWCLKRPWGPAPIKKPDGWRERQNAPQRNWEWG